ncbi:hypothetical protein RRG08_057517 [Elysia crispata]|uniref:Uncharacterized protein n=1 Tax=Elysia crispata TaxID=231223 RepID=A0AAE0YZE6_9GAST|nr:hypothetical protein RRG08_057517 [Elysia crispata]
MLAEHAKDIVIWCDNCSAQNKNWSLFMSITRYTNSNSNAGVPPKTVTYVLISALVARQQMFVPMRTVPEQGAKRKKVMAVQFILHHRRAKQLPAK